MQVLTDLMLAAKHPKHSRICDFRLHFLSTWQRPCVKVASVRLRTYSSTLCNNPCRIEHSCTNCKSVSAGERFNFGQAFWSAAISQLLDLGLTRRATSGRNVIGKDEQHGGDQACRHQPSSRLVVISLLGGILLGQKILFFIREIFQIVDGRSVTFQLSASCSDFEAVGAPWRA